MSAREEILARIRTALIDRPAPAPVPRDYRRGGGAGDVDLFVERVEDYRATVHRTDAQSVAATITSALAARGITRVVVPDGFPDDWLPQIELVREPVDVTTLDDVSAVITTCRVAIAETGTIVLDAGPGMGPRALTLVPDYHLVVVTADQVRALVPDAVAALDATRPLTWVSGPSATSDIELQRVEGVHGPRTLDVVLSA
ncbi:MAG: L-lactate dehydrogenase complex protein LldG [Pseudonocardiales bacterium]|nr:L-lactate dehydrogenase complex protein LldG [Pseudonocardiales bacterium]